METITIKIYSFDELSDDAKESAIEHYRDLYNSQGEIFWQDEIFESFKTVFEKAGIKLKDYILGLNSYSYCKIDLDKDDPVYNLKGVRALTWLENNLFSKFHVTRSEYVKNRKDYFRWGYRVGKIKECPLTGMYSDEIFLNVLTESIKNGDCLGEAFKIRLVESYVTQLQNEYDDQCSDEYIREHIIANEYKFLENGEVY